MKFLKNLLKAIFSLFRKPKKVEKPTKKKKKKTDYVEHALKKFLTRANYKAFLIAGKGSDEWQGFVDAFCRTVRIFHIKDVLLFFSQCCYESGKFKHDEESLKYSAERLWQVFPKYFKSKEECKSYAYNEKAIGDLVYGGRMGNSSKEGYQMRGRGYIQLTGASNYARFYSYLVHLSNHFKDHPKAPDFSDLNLKLEDRPRIIVLEKYVEGIINNEPVKVTHATREFFNWFSAGWFWYNSGLDRFSQDRKKVKKTTKIINGGYNGLEGRKNVYAKAESLTAPAPGQRS